MKFLPMLHEHKAENPTPQLIQCGRFCMGFFPSIVSDCFERHNRWTKKVMRPLLFISNTPVTVLLFQIDVWWLCLGRKLWIFFATFITGDVKAVVKWLVSIALLSSFLLEFFCNGIKALAKEFLNSCPDCQLHKPFPTIAPPPRPVRSFGPYKRLQADIIDMALGKNQSFVTINRGLYRYIVIIKDCLSKFCWLFPTKTNPQTKSMPLCTTFCTMTTKHICQRPGHTHILTRVAREINTAGHTRFKMFPSGS